MSEQFSGKIDIRDGASKRTIELDGDEGVISAGGNGQEGNILLFPQQGALTNLNTITVELNGQAASLRMGSNQANGDIVLQGTGGENRIHLDAGVADINLGGHGANGNLLIYHQFGDNQTLEQTTIHLDGRNGIVRAGGNYTYGAIIVRDGNGKDRIRLVSRDSTLHLGGNGAYGNLFIYPSSGDNNTHTQASIHLDGNLGDIILTNADCAEDFDVQEGEEIEPGTVMVINNAGQLQPCRQAYDKKVAGVISGAGNSRPGIVLDRQNVRTNRMPVALTGKVYCKIDTQYSPVEVGDLLTTSPTLGYAMKAEDPLRAFGAVIGKALRPFNEGRGLIPILIALQ